MKINSTILLDDLDKLMHRLSEIVAREFLPLSEAQLNWKAHEKKWSIAECLQHLNIVSDYYQPLFAKKLSLAIEKGQAPAEYFTPGWMGNYSVKSVQLKEDNRLRNKMKSPKAYRPSSGNSLLNGQAELKKYLDHQKIFIDFIAQAHKVNLNKVAVPIAIFKMISFRLGDMLRFIIYHNERHLVQAQKVRTNESFPRS